MTLYLIQILTNGAWTTISRTTTAGHSLRILEQMTPYFQASGIAFRQIQEIVSASTVVDEDADFCFCVPGV